MVGAGAGAPAAADFLLELDHADVAFCEVVVEWDAEVVREAEDVFAVAVEAVEEVAGRGLAARAGRTLDDLELGVLVITAVNEDAEVARRLARHQIAWYASVTTYFEPLMARHGFLGDYAAIRERFYAGDFEGAFDRVPDEMIAAIALAGTPADVRAQLRRYDGLLDFVMIYSPSFALPKDAVLANHEAMIRAFAAP